jgi:uncharacterized surface protein with fasciclin (FAS1) repeats
MNRKQRDTILTVLAAGLALTAGAATAQEPVAEPRLSADEMENVAVVLDELRVAPFAQEAGDIVDVAAAAGQFETLLTAVEAAGLAETLRSGGPFTVFAPTDEAFEALPEGTLDGLLADTEKLRSVLTYHVVEGRVTSDQVVGLDRAETLNGASLRIRTGDDGVRVDDARVLQTDVRASNGVIHVIDAVLLPPEK